MGRYKKIDSLTFLFSYLHYTGSAATQPEALLAPSTHFVFVYPYNPPPEPLCAS
jgi:hypothetical protein